MKDHMSEEENDIWSFFRYGIDIYIYAIKASLNKYKMIVILLAIVTSIFLCGIRSPIGAFFVTILISQKTFANVKNPLD